MYRIRSASGTEATYNSLEEFSAAVRRGEVHAEDEIFHSRANRWLDVKSHPHYRTALTWQPVEHAGHAPTPRPAAGTPASPAQQTSSRVQVFERPVIRPAQPPAAPSQTTVRPQLQATPRAEAAAPPAPASDTPQPRRYGPPPKSKELTFLDVGTSSPAPAGESRKPAPPAPKAEPPRASAPAAAKPESPRPVTKRLAPDPDDPGTELEFLVMSDGIESPVRTSAGYKAVPEDLDLLFDAPMPEQGDKPQAPARGVAVVGVPPKSPANGRSGKVPAVEAPAAPAAHAPAAPVAPAPQPPVAEVATPPVPRVHALPPEPVAAPEAAAPAPRLAPAPAPATPATPEPPRAAAPVPVPTPAPVVTPAPAARIDADMDIPAGPLLETPAATVAPSAPRAARPSRQLVPMLVGAALVIVVGTLLAWRPWKGAAEAPAPPPSVPAPAPVPLASSSTTPSEPAPAPAPGKPAGQRAPETGSRAAEPARTDTAGSDGVIAAARPAFQASVPLPSAGLSLGSETASPGPGAAVAPSELVRRLATAERQAQQELAGKLGGSGFRALLAPSRLGSTDAVTATRNAWTLGAEAIRQYRGRVARLEQAYEDSVLSSQRSQRWPGAEMSAWASRQSLAEPTETSQLVDLMFSQVNEGLDILAALGEGYSIKGSTVSFKNPASATRYASIRGWVDQRISSWSATPESTRPYTVTALLKALGDGFPAVSQ